MDVHFCVNRRLFDESVSTIFVQMYERMISFRKILNFIQEMAWPVLSSSLGIPREELRKYQESSVRIINLLHRE